MLSNCRATALADLVRSSNGNPFQVWTPRILTSRVSKVGPLLSEQEDVLMRTGISLRTVLIRIKTSIEPFEEA